MSSQATFFHLATWALSVKKLKALQENGTSRSNLQGRNIDGSSNKHTKGTKMNFTSTSSILCKSKNQNYLQGCNS
jgi:hypothetical protein